MEIANFLQPLFFQIKVSLFQRASSAAESVVQPHKLKGASA
jgi:hypothetical protein